MSPITERDPTVYEWPTEKVYLTIDFECDFGTALPENSYEALGEVDSLIALLERFDVPMTVFLQTEVLDEVPEAVQALEESSIRTAFHPHSHTHRPRDRTDLDWEVERSTDRFQTYFGYEPTGYRFPNGNVQAADYRVLADSGYQFDASLFPSWRPGHFNNRDAPTEPHYFPNHGLYELPFTVLSEVLRIPTSLSYYRLIGRPFDAMLTRWGPQTIVFNVHMHDLVTPSTWTDLPLLYRAIYARNDHGLALLMDVIQTLSRRGYSFGILDDVIDEFD